MSDIRITARVSAETHEILQKATDLSGVKNISSFIVSNSVENAKKIILFDKLSKLSDEDIDVILKEFKNEKLNCL